MLLLYLLVFEPCEDICSAKKITQGFVCLFVRVKKYSITIIFLVADTILILMQYKMTLFYFFIYFFTEDNFHFKIFY